MAAGFTPDVTFIAHPIFHEKGPLIWCLRVMMTVSLALTPSIDPGGGTLFSTMCSPGKAYALKAKQEEALFHLYSGWDLRCVKTDYT